MSSVLLYRIDLSHNLQRYYRLDLQPDLFGCWMFVREWGRIGHSGQIKETSFATLGEAQLALQRQRQVKEKRGYVDMEHLAPLIPARRSARFGGSATFALLALVAVVGAEQRGRDR